MNNDNKQPLRQIAYISIENLPITVPILEQMLTDFRQHNTVHGISGMLLHRNRGFFQVFEGPEIETLQLWKNIREDSRHLLVTELLNRPIAKRSFRDWSMGFEQIDGDMPGQSERFLDMQDVESSILAIQDKKLANLLARFIETVPTPPSPSKQGDRVYE